MHRVQSGSSGNTSQTSTTPTAPQPPTMVSAGSPQQNGAVVNSVSNKNNFRPPGMQIISPISSGMPSTVSASTAAFQSPSTINHVAGSGNSVVSMSSSAAGVGANAQSHTVTSPQSTVMVPPTATTPLSSANPYNGQIHFYVRHYYNVYDYCFTIVNSRKIVLLAKIVFLVVILVVLCKFFHSLFMVFKKSFRKPQKD